MKTTQKFLSILLSVVVLLVALPIMASAAATTNAELNNAENWRTCNKEAYATTKFSGTSGWYTVAPAKDPLNASVDAIKLYGNRSGAFGIIFNFDSDKNYEISFDYYSPKTAGETTADYDTALYGVAVSLGMTLDNYWHDVCSNQSGTSTGNWEGLTGRGEDATRVVNIVENRAQYTKGGNVTPLGKTANVWHSFSAEFSSGTYTSAALTLIMAGTGANDYYLKNIKLKEIVAAPELDPTATKATQGFEYDTLAGAVKGGEPTLETVIGGDGANTKVARLDGSDALRFTPGTAADWDDGSATALSADMYKLSFDVKIAWNSTMTPVVWFSMKTDKTNWSCRVRANGDIAKSDTTAIADATDYTVADLENGWKHIDFYFTEAEVSTVSYLQIANVSSNTLAYDIDNIVISEYAAPVTTGNAAALRAAEGDVKKGIRVKSTVNLAGIEENDIVEYGTLVTMSSLANGAELKADADFTVLKGVAFDKAAGKDVYYAADTNKKTFTGVLVNIDPYSFSAYILIRSYAKTSVGAYIYGSTLTLSVYDVVDAILAGDSAADKIVANSYINDAIEADALNSSVVTYAEWKAVQ